MIPFLIVYLGKNLTAKIPQLLYGIDVIFITVCNQVSAEWLKKGNPQLEPTVKSLRLGIGIDLTVKAIGIILGMIIYPPIVIISVFIAMLCLVVEFSVVHKKQNISLD